MEKGRLLLPSAFSILHSASNDLLHSQFSILHSVLGMRLTIHGALLFLFIPLVLFLYVRQPFGPAASVLVGLVLMFGPRFLAAPWMARHSTERCLWCGCRLRAAGVTQDASAT